MSDDRVEAIVEWQAHGQGTYTSWHQERALVERRLQEVVSSLMYHSRRNREVKVTLTIRGTPMEPELMDESF